MKKLTISLTFLLAVIPMTIAQWAPQNSGTTRGLSAVYFTDANTGYAVGGNNTPPGQSIILKTVNGGASWVPQTSGSTYCLNSVYFTDVNTGYAVGSGGIILKTTNGGSNWIPQTSGTTNYLNSVFFINSNTGFVAGTTGTILKTIDGGTNWITQSSGITDELLSLFFTSVSTGYAVGWNGSMLKTINGGTNWTSLSSGTTWPLCSVYFTDVNTGFVARGASILKTINGGLNWNEQTTSAAGDIKSLYFANANTGYAVSIGGSILKTTNGGTSWIEQSSGTSFNLFSVFFTSASTGYVVGFGWDGGGNGIILKTSNGGEEVNIGEIPNYSFESWTNFNQPAGWLVRYITASRSADKYSGNYALMLQTTIQPGNGDGTGTINSLPPNGTEGAQPAFPVSTRYTSFKGYYKFFPSGGDSCQFMIMLFKHGYINPVNPEYGNILGIGHICKSASAVYSPFSVKINYYDGFTIPDSAWISLNAYKDYNFVTMSSGDPLGNSTLYVDNLTLDNLVTSTPENNLRDESFILFPNPASDVVKLSMVGLMEENIKLNIFSAAGVLIRSEILKNNQQQFSVAGLSNGFYLVEIISKQGTGKQKLIIRR